MRKRKRMTRRMNYNFERTFCRALFAWLDFMFDVIVTDVTWSFIGFFFCVNRSSVWRTGVFFLGPQSWTPGPTNPPLRGSPQIHLRCYFSIFEIFWSFFWEKLVGPPGGRVRGTPGLLMLKPGHVEIPCHPPEERPQGVHFFSIFFRDFLAIFGGIDGGNQQFLSH